MTAPGHERLAASAPVGAWLRAQVERRGLVAAICAAPTALVAHGVFAGRRMTCHPSVAEIVARHAAVVTDARVECDGLLVTSRGPGTSFVFALAIVERLCSADVAATVAQPMML